MDFSNNRMNDKGATGLGEGLQFLPHTIYRLNVRITQTSSNFFRYQIVD
jgi:hypothetical protein